MTHAPLLKCPECGGVQVIAIHEHMFMVNTGASYVHSAKSYDTDTKAKCLECRWTGLLGQLVGAGVKRKEAV